MEFSHATTTETKLKKSNAYNIYVAQLLISMLFRQRTQSFDMNCRELLIDSIRSQFVHGVIIKIAVQPSGHPFA